MRFLTIIGFWALLNFYTALRIVERWGSPSVAAVWWGAGLLFALQLAGPFGDRLLFHKLRKKTGLRLVITIIDAAAYLTLGAVSCLVIYTLAADVVSIVWRLAAAPADPVVFERRMLYGVAGLTLATIVIGVAQVMAGPRVRRVEITLKNLPPAFEGFKIVQISDLHVGPTIGRRYVENVVGMTAALHPDLVALTGDFADGTVDDLSGEMAALADIAAPYGKFFITGNHEYYWGATAWMTEMARLGATVLDNRHVIIHKDGAAFVLAGVTDYSTLGMGADHASDAAAALAGAPAGLVKILLAHQPASYRMAEAAGFDLQLSGHTHGGQYFPFNLLVGFFQHFYKGLNRYRNLQVYVSRGVGYWGPPLRAGVPAELTLIILRPAGA